MFPDLQPDTCIVNHYTSEGSLGLHADLDESESLEQIGLGEGGGEEGA